MKSLNKPIIAISALIILIGVFAIHLSNLSKEQKSENQSEQIFEITEPKESITDETEQQESRSEYGFEEVLTHNTPEDCWVSFESSVYEIPYEWAIEHPGGFEAFMQACGNDVTEIMKIHATDLPYEILGGFKIGELKDSN